jgi:DNA helicase-2/ATP-dependent DNA helicase PcrA
MPFSGTQRFGLKGPWCQRFASATCRTSAPASGIAARARAQIGAPYLAGLNPEQRAAVETLDGPVLVLAGAGTGKTRVLTTRIAHILSLGRARPSEILAVTFTNKAAREMKTRVGAMVGQVVEGMPWLGTFHSIGVKILRRHAELVGLKTDFTILDVDDQIRLLKQLLRPRTSTRSAGPAACSPRSSTAGRTAASPPTRCRRAKPRLSRTGAASSSTRPIRRD